MIKKTVLITLFVLLVLSKLVSPYSIDTPNETTHQHITKEAVEVWKLIPHEIKNHTGNLINRSIDAAFTAKYHVGDDVITGSGEEDKDFWVDTSCLAPHFWQPDVPSHFLTGDYDRSLHTGLCVFGPKTLLGLGSSYKRSLDLWKTKVIPLYLKGEINESYYWLGRVAHLLEDASVPAHMHLDSHLPLIDGDYLEDYAANKSIYLSYDGNAYSNKQYNYENLINNFNWSSVDSRDKQHIELFRLFWYTAQKTQYFASKDEERNLTYYLLNGTSKTWDCDGTADLNLWKDEGYTSCSNFTTKAQLPANVSRVADATIPHAMKAVAGLYRLFDDAVRIDWPTENHDYRRTGFTLLKGDLTKKEDVRNQLDFFLNNATGTEQVMKPSVANLDGDDFMDMVLLVHKTSYNDRTRMYTVSTSKNIFGIKKPDRKYKDIDVLGGAAYFPPTLADLDGDGKKEIVTGVRNGTVYAYFINGSKLDIKWKYHLEPRFSPVSGIDEVSFNGGSAVDDIDLNGDMEVIVADVFESDDDWLGKVYVIDGGTGTNQTSYNLGNGGTYASVSMANVDSDDNPEIIVPSLYGIVVLDYNQANGRLEKKCNNTDGRLWGSAVIADVDKDNDYEIVYVTATTSCDIGRTCTNQLHVVNPLTCADLPNFPITFTDLPRPTPTLANLDNDSNLEIIVSLEQSVDGLGSIKAIDGVTGAIQWTYNASNTLHPGFVSPNIADIDNDGNYNVILGENNGSTVYILNHTGTLFFDYKVIGFMDNGIAIADLDNDNVAEIAFKRAASPETVFVSASAINTPPEITKISNVTAIAGDLINISQLVSASDAEGNGVNLFYSSPFNSSGQWQTTINDTGNYSILVEASDGNLSTYNFVDVIVFNQTTTKLTDNFTDGSKQKLLNFTQAGNLTVKVRLPKNATVIYSKLKVTGLAP